MKILAKDRTLLLSEAACQEELYCPDEEYDDDDLEDELYDVDTVIPRVLFIFWKCQ